MIYIADSTWYPTDTNPFTYDGTYGSDWSAFIYDLEIGYFTNVYPNAKLHVLRFSPDIDKEHFRLFDFLTYELSYKRNVILKVCGGISAENLLKQYNTTSHEIIYRSTDEEYMVHSTTLMTWESIKKDNSLLSPNMLKTAGREVMEIGLKPMLEPVDYSDYIMLDVLNGCGEIVVNSRQLGYVCTDPDAVYTPGVRLYFDVRKMIRDKTVVRDGLHLLKVRDRLPLAGYLIAVISAEDFPEKIKWTPTLFTEKANQLFYDRYVNGSVNET
jgi:hypothetical protein